MRAYTLKKAEQIVMTYDISAVLFLDDHCFLSRADNSNKHVTSRII